MAARQPSDTIAQPSPLGGLRVKPRQGHTCLYDTCTTRRYAGAGQPESGNPETRGTNREEDARLEHSCDEGQSNEGRAASYSTLHF